MTTLETRVPEQPDLVDVHFNLSDRYDSCLVAFAGRIVIEQLGDAGPPVLGAGVDLVGGKTLEKVFTGKRRGGSCPTLGANKANVVLRGVPRAEPWPPAGLMRFCGRR